MMKKTLLNISEISDKEWEQLYKTNFEMFWEKVLEDVDLSKLPKTIYNHRTFEEIKGKDAREVYLMRLKCVMEPSQFDCDMIWDILLELKHELEQEKCSTSMFDVIEEYHSRYIIY